MIEHQDSEIIILYPYIYTGNQDAYVKQMHPFWSESVIGDPYRVLIDRTTRKVIQASNEYYQSRYLAVEPSLTGDLLILGMGLAELGALVVTPGSIKWVEKNAWIAANIVPAVGTVHHGNAQDMEFLATLGTFDTILIDFEQTQINDYTSLLNIGGSVIEFVL